MAITITPADRSDITRIICPGCGDKVRSVGLLKESKVEGLTFRCKRCGKLWSLTTTHQKTK